MTIGFDGKKAVLNLTGIGNYSRRCINALAAVDSVNRLLLFVPDRKSEAATDALTPKAQMQLSPFVLKKGLAYELWRNFFQWHTIKQQGVNIFHGLSNELPFGITRSGCKTIVTIHDLIFLHHPKLYNPLQRYILRWKTKYACRVADSIIAISEMTKRDLVNYYNIAPSRINVVYQSIDEVYRKKLPDEQLRSYAQRYQLPDCYILCVGTLQERKNQHTLVKALPLLPTNVHLVLVGREEPYSCRVRQTAEELNVMSRVHIYQGIPSSDLPAFYQLATIFACLSRFEGFGIPLAEALASGLPVIGATGSCLEEAGGPHSIYLSPDDFEGLAKNVGSLLTDEIRRKEMSERGKAYSLRFTDEQLGNNLMSVYHSIV